MFWFNDLLSLVFPDLCASCRSPLNKGEECLCIKCRLHLPKTNFHLEKENPVEKSFWGKIPVSAAAAYFHFAKGENVQQIIHRMKYRGEKNVGVSVGKIYGSELKNSELFASADVIIPVPLHSKKLRQRGYNQSVLFAEGLGKSLNIPVETNSVKRIRQTDSQTRKHRYERFENVDKVFKVINPERLSGKHVLLVDDVITTGSTLTACAESILKVPGTKISIATIACA